MLRCFMLLFLLTLSGVFSVQAQVHAEQFPKLTPEQRKVLGWDFNDLKHSGLRSVADFLHSRFFSPYERSHYVAMRASGSLQPATIDLPRIISFAPKDYAILSFNGGLPGELDPPHGRNDSLDMMLWNADDQSWDFFNVNFKTGLHVEGPQLMTCFHCHHTGRMLHQDDPDILRDKDLCRFKERIHRRSFRSLDALKRYSALIH